jgi:hypothetical protein
MFGREFGRKKCLIDLAKHLATAVRNILVKLSLKID